MESSQYLQYYLFYSGTVHDLIQLEICSKQRVIHLFITIEQKKIYSEMHACERLIFIRLAKYIICSTFREKRRKHDHVLEPQEYELGRLCLSFPTWKKVNSLWRTKSKFNIRIDNRHHTEIKILSPIPGKLTKENKNCYKK